LCLTFTNTFSGKIGPEEDPVQGWNMLCKMCEKILLP
jgi:hypothetical protein